MKKKKIAVVGAGLGGMITAMWLEILADELGFEVVLYHDSNVPIERVGQGTTPDIVNLLHLFLHFEWDDRVISKDIDYGDGNMIKATKKFGVNYVNWGKKDVYHPFSPEKTSCHYVPSLLKEEVLKRLNVVDKNIKNPEKEIDSDWIYDCRGRPGDLEDYHTLTNPINSVILATGDVDPTMQHTDAIATPDGWTFVIPNQDSRSYGYLYNNTITTPEIAEKNLSNFFDVEPNGRLSFSNYIAKSIWRGERTILNGNMLAFCEPLEAASGSFYRYVAEITADYIYRGMGTRSLINDLAQAQMRRIETFILWHYMGGSKYDTPFWRYAQNLPWKPFAEFDRILEQIKHTNDLGNRCRGGDYGSWGNYSFVNWTRTQEV